MAATFGGSGQERGHLNLGAVTYSNISGPVSGRRFVSFFGAMKVLQELTGVCNLFIFRDLSQC